MKETTINIIDALRGQQAQLKRLLTQPASHNICTILTTLVSVIPGTSLFPLRWSHDPKMDHHTRKPEDNSP
jgi:hypothetical protein